MRLKSSISESNAQVFGNESFVSGARVFFLLGGFGIENLFILEEFALKVVKFRAQVGSNSARPSRQVRTRESEAAELSAAARRALDAVLFSLPRRRTDTALLID